MSEQITIDIQGGEKESRDYVSATIERSLSECGFTTIHNQVLAGEKTDHAVSTLYDYAVNQNPDLFSTTIDITSVEENEEESESDDEIDVNDSIEL